MNPFLIITDALCQIKFNYAVKILTCYLVLVARGATDLKMKRQEPFIGRLCEASVSLRLLDYADLTIMLAASHGLPYVSHRQAILTPGTVIPASHKAFSTLADRESALI